MAEVDGSVITASDVALARALSLLGLQPSVEPIRSGDIERMVDAWLEAREAARLRLEITPDEAGEAWRAAASRLGGEAALARWLEDSGIDEAWARRAVDADLRRRRFIDVRFRAFAFASEDQISEALGQGTHSGEARDRMRAVLVQDAVDRELSAWLEDARSRSRIWRQAVPPEGIPVPFP
ncbi:MAG TPA: hypothetical protein VLT62_06875 [Candidatus Methylomirabilis sp.]|nr:hypothetical protein [Candidatus Methylomirabilis sp.]